MAYKLEHFAADHQEVLQGALLDWSKDDHDIYLVSEEGHKIFTQQILLYFYSHTLGPVLDSLPQSTSTPAISVSASSSSISNLLKLLTTGQAASNNKDTLVDVKEAAKALGISLGNCLLEAKRSQGQVKIIKLPVKTEQAKVFPLKSPPTNLSIFKNRDPGIAGISKWNTVIVAQNKISRIPTDDPENINAETSSVDEEDGNTDELKLTCEVCSKVFSGKRNLRRHKYRKHQISSKKAQSKAVAPVKVKIETPSIFKCTLCDNEFDSERKLLKHTPQHTNGFNCDQCEKSFSNSGVLKSHKNIHLDEKPFKCDVCDKGFAQAGNLKTHKIRYHEGPDLQENSAETTVSVEVDISSEVAENEQSEEVVAGDKCGYCEEHFDDASELNSHMVLMHSIQRMIESSD